MRYITFTKSYIGDLDSYFDYRNTNNSIRFEMKSNFDDDIDDYNSN